MGERQRRELKQECQMSQGSRIIIDDMAASGTAGEGGDSGCYVRTPQKLAIVVSFVAGSFLGAVATILIQKLLAGAFPDWLSSSSVFVLVGCSLLGMFILIFVIAFFAMMIGDCRRLCCREETNQEEIKFNQC